MPESALGRKVDELRAQLRDETHDDPRPLHNELQAVISRLEVSNSDVPPDLREKAAELEAEIVEEFYDNLPV